MDKMYKYLHQPPNKNITTEQEQHHRTRTAPPKNLPTYLLYNKNSSLSIIMRFSAATFLLLLPTLTISSPIGIDNLPLLADNGAQVVQSIERIQDAVLDLTQELGEYTDGEPISNMVNGIQVGLVNIGNAFRDSSLLATLSGPFSVGNTIAIIDSEIQTGTLHRPDSHLGGDTMLTAASQHQHLSAVRRSAWLQREDPCTIQTSCCRECSWATARPASLERFFGTEVRRFRWARDDRECH